MNVKRVKRMAQDIDNVYQNVYVDKHLMSGLEIAVMRRSFRVGICAAVLTVVTALACIVQGQGQGLGSNANRPSWIADSQDEFDMKLGLFVRAGDFGSVLAMSQIQPWWTKTHPELYAAVHSPSGTVGRTGASGGGGGRGPSQGQPVVITGIRPVGQSVTFDVAWLPGYPRGSALDVFGTPGIAAPAWGRLRREPVPPWASAHTFTVDLPGPAGWAAAGFFQVADLTDSDGDGLTDAEERLVYGSDPDRWSSALDGVPDSVKARWGIDPGDPGASAIDHDNDGLTTGEEIGYAEIKSGFVPEDMSNSVDLLLSYPVPFVKNYNGFYDYGFGSVFLGAPAYFSGEWCRRLWVELNGVVLIQRRNNDVALPPPNALLLNTPQGWPNALKMDNYVAVAALWVDTYARNIPPHPVSKILTKWAVWQGRPCIVIEYRDMCTAGLSLPITFQVIVELSRPNTVHVGYITVRNANGASLLPNTSPPMGVWNKRTGCEVRTCIYPGMPYPIFSPSNGTWITYHVGTGTDPLDWDTDGDGLSDGDEVKVWGSDPLKYSTAGDWIPDGWKVKYGIHPTNAVAHLPAAGGMTYFEKYCHGCDPRLVDTDGDGVPDIDEIPKSPGSDPTDPMDGGNPANCVTVKLSVGDPSSSRSERWEMDLTNDQTGITRHACALDYGTTADKLFALVKGRSYTFRIRHTGTNRPEGPDYDWLCLIDGSDLPGPRIPQYGSGVIVIEDPQFLLNPLFNGDDINLAKGRTGKIHVPKYSFLQPAGNPVTEPQDSGGGQNQFTFTPDSPGTLTMTLMAMVEPAGSALKIAEHLRFEVGDIGNSVMQWHASNPNGKPSVGPDGGMYATVTFTGMPQHNDDFGWKTAKLWMGSTLVASNKYGVFFPKSAANYPGVPTWGTPPPNWFYYWKEGGVCGITDQCEFHAGMSSWGQVNPEVPNPTIDIGFNAATTNALYTFYPRTDMTLLPAVTYPPITVGSGGKGIQSVAETIRHEKYHIQIFQQFGISPVTIDADQDRIPDIQEVIGFMGMLTATNTPNTYLIGGNRGDEEIRCQLNAVNLNFPIFPEKDWANPGCQHYNQFGPKVNP